jgi:hypothetical protein
MLAAKPLITALQLPPTKYYNIKITCGLRPRLAHSFEQPTLDQDLLANSKRKIVFTRKIKALSPTLMETRIIKL